MVYIDLDKPTECGGCPMLLEDDQCGLQAVWHNEWETQYAACPLVEVVRCKDCKYGEERIEDYRCFMLDEDWDIRFSPMHFCSYGRRKEDGEA